MKRNIILSLSSIIFSLLAGEGFLRWVDPTGAYAYIHDNVALLNASVYDERMGYRVRPGTYHLIRSTVTVTPEGRRVPDTESADCTIVALGDSVTYGAGVNDRDTWVNLVARNNPEAHFVNTALPGYNSGNLVGALETHAADGYIWLTIGNDDQYPLVWEPAWDNPVSEVSGLLAYFAYALYETEPGWPRFQEDLEAIMGRDSLLVFGFEDEPLSRQIQAQYPQVVLIPRYDDVVSPADSHPSVEGHRQIAEVVSPAVSEFVADICG